MDQLTRDLVLAQDGDVEAFSRAVRNVQPEIHRFCAWSLGSARDTDDVVQETLLRMYKGLDSFRADARGISWVLTIARRACLDHARHTNRQQRLILTLENESANTPSNEISSALDVNEIVNSLPEILRESFVLVKIFGFSYSEVAVLLDCPLGTVQSRVARARMSLATDFRLTSLSA